jgi:hypothetical protein
LPPKPTSGQIKDLVFVEAIVISVPLIFADGIFTDKKPPIPPSKAASKTQPKQNYAVFAEENCFQTRST